MDSEPSHNRYSINFNIIIEREFMYTSFILSIHPFLKISPSSHNLGGIICHIN